MKANNNNKLNEWLKSSVVVSVPILISGAILKANNVSALIRGLVMMGLITISDLTRKQIKQREKNELFIFLIFLLFFPAGFYYLWKYSKRNNVFKIIATVLFILILVLVKNFLGTLQ